MHTYEQMVLKIRWIKDLNGARFSNPSSEMEETKATGRGIIPDTMLEYIFLLERYGV